MKWFYRNQKKRKYEIKRKKHKGKMHIKLIFLIRVTFEKMFPPNYIQLVFALLFCHTVLWTPFFQHFLHSKWCSFE